LALDLTEKRVGLLDLHPASFAPTALRGEDVHLAAEVTDVVNLLVPLLPRSHPTGDDLIQVLAALAYSTVRPLGEVDDHIRVEAGQRAGGVPGVERLVHPAHDLDVLLRNTRSRPFHPSCVTT